MGKRGIDQTLPLTLGQHTDERSLKRSGRRSTMLRKDGVPSPVYRISSLVARLTDGSFYIGPVGSSVRRDMLVSEAEA